MDRRANRTALAREARRIAEEVEGLYIQLEQVGALARVRHYMDSSRRRPSIRYAAGRESATLLRWGALAYCQCNGDAQRLIRYIDEK
jgi:hypothetical protein